MHRITLHFMHKEIEEPVTNYMAEFQGTRYTSEAWKWKSKK